jgi:hypothetical protein
MLKIAIAIIMLISNAVYSYAEDEIIIKCEIKDTVSGKIEDEILKPESQNIVQIYKFYKKNIEIGPFYNDFSQIPPVLNNSSKKDMRWIVEVDGLKILPVLRQTINRNKSSEYSDVIVTVDDNSLGYMENITVNNKELFLLNKTSITINRITGIVKGEIINHHYGAMSLLITEYNGKCSKAEKKF